jgi:drug/metabolite transporter (DMT)-like permease
MSVRQMIGIAVSIAGLMLLVLPSAFDLKGSRAILGCILPVLAAMCWSVSIIYTRVHRWTASPLQLMPWQCLLAGVVLAMLALGFERLPPTSMSRQTILALVYNGVIGTALGFWAMTVVSRRVPATAAVLGVLATPVVGIGLAAVQLGERPDPILVLSAIVIMVGIAVSLTPRRQRAVALRIAKGKFRGGRPTWPD